MDLGTLQLIQYAKEGTVAAPGEWWLATDGADDPSIVAALAKGRFPLDDIRSRAAETSVRLADPIAVGLFGTLALTAVAVVIFAVLSLAASSLATNRARRGEYALMRALGLSRRELAVWLALEEAFPVAVGLIGGMTLGIVLGVVVLPATTRAPDGLPPVPPATVAVPWDLVSVAALAGAVATVIAVAALFRAVASAGVAETLRNDAPGGGT
jgi:predicted lysophospholipase L1 biosynthesis ABC-type transport system permease subunit